MSKLVRRFATTATSHSVHTRNRVILHWLKPTRVAYKLNWSLMRWVNMWFFSTVFNLDARDPNKRRVKPVERHLIQLNFGLSDSEEDSDFDINDHAGHGKCNQTWIFLIASQFCDSNSSLCSRRLLYVPQSWHYEPEGQEASAASVFDQTYFLLYSIPV